MNNNDEVSDDMRKEIERSMLNDAVLEKEELQNQLTGAFEFTKYMIEHSKSVVRWFCVDYNMLWDEYRNKKNELDKINNYVECINVETNELHKTYEASKCNLKVLEDKNSCLEENIDELEKCLNGEYTNIKCLHYQNQSQRFCLEQKSEKLAETKQKLVEITDELNRENTQIRDTLKPKLDGFVQEAGKLKSKKSQNIQNVDRLLKELEMERNHTKELNQTIRQQKNQNQKLTEVFEECNEKIQVLKQTVENENVWAENRIDKLRKEILNVDNERRYLDNEFKQSKKELHKFEYQNDQLTTDVKRLQFKIDGVNKNSDEYQKLSIEKMEKKQEDFKKLMIDLNSKERIIVELEKKLSETRKMHKTESENARSFKMQLVDLNHKPEIINSQKYKKHENISGDSDHNIIDCSSQINCSVLIDFKSAGENIITTTTKTVKRTDSADDFEEKNRELEKLIEKCNSLVNDF